MADLTKIFDGMEAGPEAIQKNFEAVNANEQDLAKKYELGDWQKCTLLDGTTGSLAVRWSSLGIELMGQVTLADKTKSCDIAYVPANWDGAFSAETTNTWEDVWEAPGQGSTTYQVSMMIGGGNGNKLHFYQLMKGSDETASKLIHIHRTWFKG